jgi:hypothetical protein
MDHVFFVGSHKKPTFASILLFFTGGYILFQRRKPGWKVLSVWRISCFFQFLYRWVKIKGMGKERHLEQLKLPFFSPSVSKG